MHNLTLKNIGKIIERDSKDTTYKFALMRGVIDIIQENSPFIKIQEGRAIIPCWLMVEKWLLYYYPIMNHASFIPQKNGEQITNSKKLAFRLAFEELTIYYFLHGGFSQFYVDLKKQGIPTEVSKLFLQLCDKILETIVKMPMKYIGGALSSSYYSIFNYENTKKRDIKGEKLDASAMLFRYGNFSIPIEYYEVFKLLGSFISGNSSILHKWAEFTSKASNGNISVSKALEILTQSPVEERDTLTSRRIFDALLKESGQLECIWTGRPLRKYDLDHLIPFSVWHNNDLWNLLPANPSVNNQKRDKIPSPGLLKKRKRSILNYWVQLHSNQNPLFLKELRLSLLGQIPDGGWQEASFKRLMENCEYLIEERGYEPWII